jgi:hypothetical protein
MIVGSVLCVSLALALAPFTGGAVQAGDDGASYADPSFGWAIAWDPELWMLAGTTSTGMNDAGVAGTEVVISGIDQMALGAVFVGSQTAFAGDLAACLETITAEILMISGISDTRAADLPLPDAPKGAEQAISLGLLTGPGIELEGVVYTECRPLPTDDAVLSIRWLLPDSETYEDTLPIFEDLIAGFDPEGGEAVNAAADDENDQAEEASAEDEPSEYTDPTFGWSITWDPEVWEGQEPEVIEGEDGEEGNLLDLYGADVSLGGVTVASLPSPTFAGDLDACVAAIRPMTAEELGGEDGGYVDNLREPDLTLPDAPSDAVGKLFEWDAGIDESQIGYFECRPLVEDEVVLFITWTLPVGEPYEDHLPAFEELISGLDLSDVHPDEE